MSIDMPVTLAPNIAPRNANTRNVLATTSLIVLGLTGCGPDQASNVPNSAPYTVTGIPHAGNPDQRAKNAHGAPLVTGNECLPKKGKPSLYEEVITIPGTDGSTILTGTLQFRGSDDTVCNGLRFGRFDPQMPADSTKNTTHYLVEMDTEHSDGEVDHLEQPMPDFSEPDATRDPDWQAWTDGSATRRYKIDKPEVQDKPVVNICVTAVTDRVAQSGLRRCLPPIDILDTGHLVRVPNGESIFIS